MPKASKFGRVMARRRAKYFLRRVPRNRFSRGLVKQPRNGYYRTKIISVMSLYNQSGTGTDVSQAYDLHFPTFFRDNDGIVRSMTTRSKHYLKCFSLFDEYKVTGLAVSVRHPYSKFSEVDGVAFPTGNSNYPIIYGGKDDDSDELIVDVASAITQVGVKRSQLQAGRAFKLFMRPAFGDRKKWFNTSILNPNEVPNTPNTITDKMPPRGSLRVYLENVVNTNIAMDVMCTWYVTFRGLSLTQNPDTSQIFKDYQGMTGTAQDVPFDTMLDLYNGPGFSNTGGGITAGYIPL